MHRLMTAKRLNRVRRTPVRLPARQRGQAVILVAVTAVILLLGALLVYNVGQLNLTKTKLQNTADSAAYSGALLLSRSYNFAAYSNRAMVANQVAIAQMVSLASWSRYYCTTFTDTKCGKFTTDGTDELIQVALELITGGEPGISVNSAYQGYSKGIFNVLKSAIPPIVSGLDKLELLLSGASKAYYTDTLAELALDVTRTGPMSQVVQDNDPNAEISTFGLGTVGKSINDVRKFVTTYKPKKRKAGQPNRFHDVVTGSLDKWTKARKGPEIPPFTSALTSVGECFGEGAGFMIETGGWFGSTKLNAANTTWTANDKGIFVGAGVCIIVVEVPFPVPIPIPLVIPATPSTGKAVAGDKTDTLHNIKTYSGLRPYLGVKDLNKPDMETPTLTLFVRRESKSIDTTHQMHERGENIAGNQLDLKDSESGKQMQVAASSNAYFARPEANLTLGKYTVYGNMFNPYWEAHLVDTPDALVAAEVAAQGIVP